MGEETSSRPGDRVRIENASGVAEVTINRRDKLNALDSVMFEAIIAAGERLSRTAGLRAVVLTGAGRGFSAGLDKETFAATAARRRAPGLAELMPRTHGIANAWQQAAYIWRTLPVPVIAAIQAFTPALSSRARKRRSREPPRKAGWMPLFAGMTEARDLSPPALP